MDVCPRCRTELTYIRTENAGNQLWCPKCKRFLSDINQGRY